MNIELFLIKHQMSNLLHLNDAKNFVLQQVFVTSLSCFLNYIFFCKKERRFDVVITAL